MPGNILIIRIRSKNGVSRLQNLNTTSTFSDLKKAIADDTKIQISCLKILQGYPPTAMVHSDESITLSELSFKDGELLTIEESAEKLHTSPVLASCSSKLNSPESSKVSYEVLKSSKYLETSNQLKSIRAGTVKRQVVPANNSCLFTSVYFVMENGTVNLECQKTMRDFIAKTVKNDPETFNDAILGKSTNAYCDWIRNPSSWGGCIELSVLAKYYKKEICVADIRTGRIDRFGEDQNYMTRVFIIYDGIHFDPLYLQLEGCGRVQTVFSTQDDVVMTQVSDLTDEAKRAKKFTNVENFKLRCLVCQSPLEGQVAAQNHAEKTGHINFGEI